MRVAISDAVFCCYRDNVFGNIWDRAQCDELMLGIIRYYVGSIVLQYVVNVVPLVLRLCKSLWRSHVLMWFSNGLLQPPFRMFKRRGWRARRLDEIADGDARQAVICFF